MVESTPALRFPEISEERLSKMFRYFTAGILVGDWEFIENAFGASLRRENSSLYRYIGKVVNRERMGQDPDFRMGAYYVYSVLDPNLPRVNRVIISQYDRQFRAYASFLRDNIESDVRMADGSTEDRLGEIITAAAKQYHPELRVDFDYPAEENRLLRRFLCTRSVPFVFGGLTVYELKRRAFFARHLKKAFGT